jgi:hypothetical protein
MAKTIKVTIGCEVKASFESLGTKKENAAFRKQIEEWVKDALLEDATFIPFYDENGVEHCTEPSKIFVWLED